MTALLVAGAAPADHETVAAAPSADLPAVVLRRVIPQTPLETAGSGEAPTVDVRVRVTEKGRVGEVEIRRVRPSGAHDDAFIAAVEESLEGWRFAPAIAAGQPASATFDWSLEFRPLEAASPDRGGHAPGAKPSSIALDTLLRDNEPKRFRLLRIYALPVDQQRRHLERQVAEATACFGPEPRHTADSQLFRIVTDHPDEQFAAAVAHNLTTTYAILADLLGPEIPLQPPGFKIAVFVYRSRAEYLNLIHAIDGIEETSGFFAPPGLIAFHAELGSSEELLSVMIHEAVHAFVFRTVVRPGQDLPRWLDEGFADYVGRSAITKGHLELGRHRASHYVFTPSRVVRAKTEQQVELEHLKREIRRGEGMSVDELVDASRETFYGSSMARFYAQSWLLVHLLQHGEPGWDRQAFPRLLLYAAEGYPPIDALQKVYGVGPGELEQRYRDYAHGF